MGMIDDYQMLESRRQFLQKMSAGLGTVALSSLLPGYLNASNPTGLHHPAKAKKIIYLYMGGAPSQLDLFDYKPQLEKEAGKKLPDHIRNGQRIRPTTASKSLNVMPSMFKFKQHGEGRLWMSELLPHLATVADDLTMIRSMHTNSINHDPGKTMMLTGSEIPGKASIGSWLSYGLGSLNKNLPDFVVLPSAFWTGGSGNVQGLYSRLWGSGYLPSHHQGVAFQPSGDPVLFLSNPKGVSRKTRHKMLDIVSELNAKHESEIGDPEIATTIRQQEMAFKMQASVPELTDLSGEPQHIKDMYGPEVEKSGSFARNCLLARRMIERDVRFVQLFHRGWDHHSNLPRKLRGQCYDVDQACTALINDLKQRGLLSDTLIVWGGEFGRTVYGERGSRTDYGRDHHPRCFSIWMAGGGIKGGHTHGTTDDYSYNIIDKNKKITDKFEDDAVSINNLNATILHQLGVDHTRLSFPFKGLDQKLTSISNAEVVKKIIK